MGVPFPVCDELLQTAVENLFDCDPQIQAVEIGRHEAAFGFKAVKKAAKILPQSVASGARHDSRAKTHSPSQS